MRARIQINHTGAELEKATGLQEFSELALNDESEA